MTEQNIKKVGIGIVLFGLFLLGPYLLMLCKTSIQEWKDAIHWNGDNP